LKYKSTIKVYYLWGLGIGDWGLGIAQSPIPNPQSPIIFIYTNAYKFLFINIINKTNKLIFNLNK